MKKALEIGLFTLINSFKKNHKKPFYTYFKYDSFINYC